MKVSEPGKKSVLHSLESWGSTEEMLGVFQNTLPKWFGEEARLIRETQTTECHIFGGMGRGGELLQCANNPRLVFAAFYALWHHEGVTQRQPQGLSLVIFPHPVEAVSFTCPLPPNCLLVLSGRSQWGQLVAEILPCLQGWERLV